MRILILYILTLQFVYSQVFSDISFIGSRSVSTAGSMVASPKGEESVFYNPAGLTNSSNMLSFFYGKTDIYNLKFLKHQYFSFKIPIGDNSANCFAISAQSLNTSYPFSTSDFGSLDGNLSEETAISFSHGIELLKDRNSTLSIGYNLNYFIFYQAPSAGPNGDGQNGFSSAKSETFSLDFGIHASLRKKINFGAFLKNITSTRIGRGASLSFLPRKMNIGIGYTPFSGLSTNFSLERIIGTKKSSFRFGLEYLVTKYFEVRSGVQMSTQDNGSNRFGAGFTIHLPYVDFSYGILTHPILDNSSTFDIKVHFEK